MFLPFTDPFGVWDGSSLVDDDPAPEADFTLGELMSKYDTIRMRNREDGEEIRLEDKVKNVDYVFIKTPNFEGNATVVTFESYDKPIIFERDLVYETPMRGDVIHYTVTVFERYGVQSINEFYEPAEVLRIERI